MPPPPLRRCTASRWHRMLNRVEAAHGSDLPSSSGDLSTLTKRPRRALPNGAAFAQSVTVGVVEPVVPHRRRSSTVVRVVGVAGSSTSASRGRATSADRSTVLPDASVTTADSSTPASALLRRTSATSAGRLPPCDDLVGELLRAPSGSARPGGPGTRSARRRRSATSVLSAIASRTNCARTDFSALSRSSASNSSRVLPCSSQVLVEQRVVVAERVHDLVLAVLDLGLDRRLGQRELDRVEQLLEHLVARLRALLERLGPAEPLAQVVAQLLDRVELAGQLGELVVELGQFLLLDRVDRRGDVGLARRRARPAVIVLVKVADSPADLPTSASSRPSIRSPLPTS